MHRALPARRINVGKFAEAAGRFTGSLMRTIPGAAGALSVAVGLGMIYRPLFLLAVGGFLLILDRRVP